MKHHLYSFQDIPGRFTAAEALDERTWLDVPRQVPNRFARI